MRVLLTRIRFKMFSEKLQELTVFPPSIIYHFVAEAIGNPKSAQIFQKYHIPCFMQFNDVLNTYLHIQNDILPEIRGIGITNISAEKWYDYFKRIHRQITPTLAQFQHFESAEIREGSMIISKSNSEILGYICIFLRKDIGVSKSEFCENLSDEFSIGAEVLSNFMDLLTSMAERNDVVLPISSQTSIPKDDLISLCLERLIALYLNDGLTSEQKLLVEEIGKPCVFPESIEEMMVDFFDKFSQKINAIAVDDEFSIAEFMAYSFSNLMKIHPFCNGNGRAAMAFVNMILKALDKNPICFYYGHEKNDTRSEYYSAIQALFQDETPMTALIFKRMHEEIPEDLFGFEKTRTYVDFCQFLISENKKNPHQTVDFIFTTQAQKYRTQLGFSDEHVLNTRQTQVLLQKIIQQTSFTVPSIFSASAPDIALLLDQHFPHSKKWKYYPKAQIALLECHNLEEAKILVGMYNETGAMQAAASKIAATGVFVVKACDINLEKIISLRPVSP